MSLTNHISRHLLSRTRSSPSQRIALFATSSSTPSTSSKSNHPLESSTDKSHRPSSSVSSSASTSTNEQKQQQISRPKTVAERDDEMLQKMLERDGGTAAVGMVGGEWEGGMGPNTKKNLFRVI